MRRLDNGTPIRTAMKHAGLDIKGLAAKTREVDPDGRGLAKSAIYYMVGTGKSAREEHSDRAAILVAEALAVPVSRLFVEDPLPMASESTSTRRMQIEMTDPAPLEPLVDQRALNEVIGKSETWVYRQRRQFPASHETPFPVHYIGRRPKYRVSEVLAWNALVYAPVAA